MLSILTINAALQDIKILGRSVYRPVKYIHDRLAELASRLIEHHPDVICLQELFHPGLQQQVYSLLKADYPFAVGFTDRRFRFRLGNELIVFSRFPLGEGKLYRFENATVEEHMFTSKGFLRVLLDCPAGKLQLVNIHLTAGGLNKHPEDQGMEVIRTMQIRQLTETISHDIPTIIVGDLNAGPDSSQVNYQAILDTGYTDTFEMTGNTGFTWDPENPLVISGDENHLPAQRIDHIFMNDKSLDILKPVTGNIVLNECSILLDDNSRIPVSDHYGLMVQFHNN